MTIKEYLRGMEAAKMVPVNSGPTATYARTFSHGITDF